MPDHPPPQDEPPDHPGQAVIDQLVGNHRDFLNYVERRVGNKAIAEEIVQDAFVRGLDHGGEIRESVVGWFYRVLRNAVVDHQRRQTVANRRLDDFAAELATTGGGGGDAADGDVARVACACVTRLAAALKPEYAEALRRIEVDRVSVKDYARMVGISTNNAGVRIFRARQALRRQVALSCGTCAEHGCLDCTCGAPSSGRVPAPRS